MPLEASSPGEYSGVVEFAAGGAVEGPFFFAKAFLLQKLERSKDSLHSDLGDETQDQGEDDPPVIKRGN